MLSGIALVWLVAWYSASIQADFFLNCGSSLSFLVWGALHGTYLIMAIVLSNPKEYILNMLNLKGGLIHKIYRVTFTFTLVVFAWIFFRANNISDAFYVINNMFADIGDYTDLEKMKVNLRGLGVGIDDMLISMGLIAFLELYNLYERSGDVWKKLERKPIWIRWSFYYILLFGILFLAPYSRVSNFIYFQF